MGRDDVLNEVIVSASLLGGTGIRPGHGLTPTNIEAMVTGTGLFCLNDTSAKLCHRGLAAG